MDSKLHSDTQIRKPMSPSAGQSAALYTCLEQTSCPAVVRQQGARPAHAQLLWVSSHNARSARGLCYRRGLLCLFHAVVTQWVCYGSFRTFHMHDLM